MRPNIMTQTLIHTHTHTLNTMDIALLLQITLLVLFITSCILKITSERHKQSKVLFDFDTRHAVRTVELNALLEMIEQDKKNGLI